ncbi:redoxin domain-containing protein [Malikia spinosa]|uniref:redoxin domain-containing protein n=2 Tax=Malikia spinosa TaxID=86180 RepID=UPI002FDA9C87
MICRRRIASGGPSSTGSPFTIEAEASVKQSCRMSVQKNPLLVRLAQQLRIKWKSYLGNLVLLLLLLTGVQLWQTRDVTSGPAPELAVSVLGADGKLVTTTLSAWRALHPAEPVAIHFWAEWCPICRTEENSITRLSRDWPVLTVAMQSGGADQVRATLRQRELPWQAVIDPSGDITRAHGFHAVPSFLVVDAKGQIRTPAVGYQTEMGMRLRLWWVKLTS